MRIFRRAIGVVVVFAAVLAASPASAQQINTGLGIGVLGGVTWTSVNTENDLSDFDLSTNSGTGYVFGVWFGGNRDGRAGLMGEVNYMTKKFTVTEDEEEFEQETTYVSIPVLLRINTGYRERDKPSLYFLVGPAFDIQINAKQNDVDSPDDFYEGLDIGLMVGAGFEVFRIGIEGRYQWGLKSVLGTDAAEETGFGSTKLNTFSVVGKFRFN